MCLYLKKKKSLQLMLYDGMYGFSLKTSYVATSLYLKQIKYVNMFWSLKDNVSNLGNQKIWQESLCCDSNPKA